MTSFAGIARIALAIALALGVVAASLFGAKDSRILTSPPERELNGFLVMIANRRYDRAPTLLSTDMERRITKDSLRVLGDRIVNRIGEIRKIHTDRRWSRDDRSVAAGHLEGKDRRLDFEVPLVRERGVWKIADLTPIRTALSGP